MSDMSKLEKAQAAGEARAVVASRPAGSSSAAVAAAMQRFLGAEQYHELQGESDHAAAEQGSDDQPA